MLTQLTKSALALVFVGTLTACGAADEASEELLEPGEASAAEDLGQASENLCSPSVSYVSPISAVLNQEKIFSVVGSCLPSTTAFWIAECANLTKLGWSPSQVVFTCTPSYSTGLKPGVVKDQPGGVTLKNFTVQVTY
jgi:hypothetical protein